MTRFAFTAQFCDGRAVVCRVVENCPRHVVQQEYGEFESWTLADAFAARLNQKLGIDPLEARLLVTLTLLLRDRLLHSALKSCGPWCIYRNPSGRDARKLEHGSSEPLSDTPLSIPPCAAAVRSASH